MDPEVPVYHQSFTSCSELPRLWFIFPSLVVMPDRPAGGQQRAHVMCETANSKEHQKCCYSHSIRVNRLESFLEIVQFNFLPLPRRRQTLRDFLYLRCQPACTDMRARVRLSVALKGAGDRCTTNRHSQATWNGQRRSWRQQCTWIPYVVGHKLWRGVAHQSIQEQNDSLNLEAPSSQQLAIDVLLHWRPARIDWSIMLYCSSKFRRLRPKNTEAA